MRGRSEGVPGETAENTKKNDAEQLNVGRIKIEKKNGPDLLFFFTFFPFVPSRKKLNRAKNLKRENVAGRVSRNHHLRPLRRNHHKAPRVYQRVREAEEGLQPPPEEEAEGRDDDSRPSRCIDEKARLLLPSLALSFPTTWIESVDS